MKTLKLAVLVAVATHLTASAAAIVYQAGFEVAQGYNVPPMPNTQIHQRTDWDAGGDNLFVFENSQVKTGAQAAGSFRSTGTNSTYLWTESSAFSPVSVGTLTVEVAMRPTAIDSSYQGDLYVKTTPSFEGGSDRAAIITFVGNGNLRAYNGVTLTTLTTWTNGTWYNLKAVFDLPSKTYDVYVNNVLLANDFAFLNPVSIIGSVGFKEYSGVTGSSLYVDDVVVMIPEPASLALAGLGGLLMLRRRR